MSALPEENVFNPEVSGRCGESGSKYGETSIGGKELWVNPET
jgi:hypothetical protein